MKEQSIQKHQIASLPRRLGAIREVLLREYTKRHRYPWLVAYSGGKDSTLLLQLVWEMLLELPRESRTRRVLVVGNDTLVESPLVIRHLRKSMSSLECAAVAEELPVETEITEPCVDQTFWVNVIGRGYIPPTRNFRWCTDRMKILPTTRLLERYTQDTKGSVLLVGTRRSESETRRRAMERRGASATRMNPQGSVRGCKVFSPLADLSDDDVWMTLIQRKPPWGGTHRELITLYRNAGGGECPLVMTKEDAPSCGSASPRFGCWTCTVVQKDRSLRGTIDAGHAEADSLEALFAFREWLVEMREDANNRMTVRRNGNAKQKDDGSPVLGPFKLEVRQHVLDKLRELERRVGRPLISPAELSAIEDIWWRDQIREDARQQLNRSLLTTREDYEVATT